MTTNEDQYSLTGWSTEGPKRYDLKLPSGQVCLIQPLELERILEMGLIDALDTFSGSLIPNNTKKKKPADRAKTKKQQDEEALADIMGLLGDPEKFGKLKKTMDQVAVECVVKPQVFADLGKDEEPVPGRLYVSRINFMDKMEIFSSVMDGMGDLGRFREGSEDGVGDVAEKSGPGNSAEPDVRDKESS